MFIKIIIFDREPTGKYKKPDEIITGKHQDSKKCIEDVCKRLKARR